MNAKFLVVGAVVGGILLFVWGGLTHAFLPQVIPAYQIFKDDAAVVQTLHANAPANGVYFSPKGILAAVAFLPDLGDKTKDITPNLITQFLTDTLSALLLCWLLAGIRSVTALGRAGWLTLAAFAAFSLKILPYWNWYGFSPLFMLLEALDIVGKFFIAGLVLGALMNKLGRSAA